MPAKGVPPVWIVNVLKLRIVFYHYMIDYAMKAAPTMALLAGADTARAFVIITGIPAWIIRIIFRVAPVTVTRKISLKFHVMKILGRVERLPIFIEAYILIPRIVVVIGTRMTRITSRERLFPMTVLTGIRIRCNYTGTILRQRL
jgi:hypothetical protein